MLKGKDDSGHPRPERGAVDFLEVSSLVEAVPADAVLHGAQHQGEQTGIPDFTDADHVVGFCSQERRSLKRERSVTVLPDRETVDDFIRIHQRAYDPGVLQLGVGKREIVSCMCKNDADDQKD